MKKFAIALLLPALILVSFTCAANGQSRPRRVGTPQPLPPVQAPPADPDPSTTAPSRPPVLRGLTNSSDDPQAAASNPSKPGSEEVGEGETIRVSTSLVTVPVSVMDRSGLYIPNLKKEDFHIFENGVEQQVAYFAAVEKPFTVALVIDTSGSTRFQLEDIQNAAIAFVDQLRPGDKVMVVSFNDRINFLTEPTNNREELRSAIRSTRTGGGTRLYDTVDILIKEHLNRISGRKAIVLFTDGVDTTSRQATYESTLEDAEELDSLIFPVEYDTYDPSRDMGNGGGGWGRRGGGRGGRGGGITILGLPIPTVPSGGNGPWGGRRGGGGGGGGTGTSREEYDKADRYLNALAEETGARMYRSETLDNITESFRMVAEELRRQYSLGYYPKTPAQAGERRQIKVRVNEPGMVVRARDSYVFKGGTQASVSGTDDTQPSQPPVLRRQPQAGP